MKTIHATLLAHEALLQTTTCLLVKVECVGAYAGTTLGFTNLDIDVTYNDGDGALTYAADNGFTPRRFVSRASLGVDDGELEGVIASSGITESDIRAGMFDAAKVTVYRVNYEDLTSGRHEVMEYGRAGQTRYHRLGWVTEFRSLSQLLKQTISQVYSLTCRAQFGDARCGKAFVWTAGTVTSVGTEADQQFTDSGLVVSGDFYDAGVIRWLTGDNAGMQMEIGSYSGGAFELALPMPFNIQNGDTFEARQDCIKTFEYCRDVHANTDNFRGENTIPVDGTAMVPGAEIERR